MSASAKGIVVNCAAASLPSVDQVEEVRAEALRLLELGEGGLERARNILAQAARIEELRAELGPVETEVDLDPDELESIRAAGAEADQALRRAQRDALLASSDWTQAGDVSLDDPAGWRRYRQELRDLTFDTEPDWPEAPK